MYDLVRPQMVEEPVLEIRQGRHLLYEKIMGYGRYVMNDTYMRGGAGDDRDCSMVRHLVLLHTLATLTDSWWSRAQMAPASLRTANRSAARISLAAVADGSPHSLLLWPKSGASFQPRVLGSVSSTRVRQS